jgi:chitinase
MSRYLTARRTGLSLLVTFTLAAVGCLAEQGPDDETPDADESSLSAAQCAAAASWSTSTAYAVGAIVSYQSKVYTCLQAHTSQAGWTPAAVPALWHEETCAGSGSTSASSSAVSSSAVSSSAVSSSAGSGGGTCGTVWHQGTPYVTGDIVIFNGSLYIATHDNPGYDPTISTWFWSPYAGCSTGSGGAGGAGGGSSSSTTSSSTTGGGGSGGAGGAGGGGGGNPGGKLFVGYYQTWSDSWKANGADTVLAKLPAYVNVVNISFAQPDMNYVAGSLSLGGTGIGLPYDGPTFKAAVAALHQKNPGTRVMLSVGGATFPNFGGFNPTTVAAFVKDFGLDGVDIDYEPASPSCTASGGVVSCPSDAEYVSVVKSMRAKLPAPYWISIAAFSVGAYGEGAWASAPPSSSYMGISLAVLKQAGSALDLVNVMSYDAGPSFDPVQALHAYQHFYTGRIAMGIEVPPEAWGGHITTVAEIDTLANAVNSSNAAGLMLWSIQKPGPAQQFATEMCLKLGLGGCSTPML